MSPESKPRPGPAVDVGRAIEARARELGFDAVGFARADEPLEEDFDRYAAFIDAGRHGAMRYLAEHAEARRRLDGDAILPGARSVVCLARRYARADGGDPALAQGIARYARGRDYHGFLKKRLRKLASFVESLGAGVRARALCDIEPVLERAWAARSGIGFVGKHGLVITPGHGSYQLLGEVVTTLELPPGVPLAERCGTCTRCLDACPTSAFVAPWVLDPRRCVSYLTIEAKEAPAEELRAGIGDHLFGCDACQEACPFNRTAPPEPGATAPFHPKDAWGRLGLADLVGADAASWDSATKGSPVRRAGRAGLARNAVVVAANRLLADPADPGARAALEAAARHDDPAVRELAGDEARRVAASRPE